MKRKLIASAMAATLAMSVFTGCSSATGEDTAPETTTPENNETEVAQSIVPDMTEPVTIELWHYMTGNQEAILNEIIDEFNEINEWGITVEALAQGRITEINQKVIAASQSNTLPALINVYPDAVTSLVEKDQLFDIMPFVVDEEVGMLDDLTNDFNEAFVAEVAQWEEGELYGMPMTKSTEVVYVNQTLLEELGYTIEDVQGITFEELAKISEESREQLGIPGFGFDASANAYISASKMMDIDYVELDGTINIDNEWVREYMEFFREQTMAGNFRIPGEDMYLSGPFSNQEVLMYQGSSAGIGHIDTNGEFELAVIEVPHFEGKEKAVIQQGGSIFVTNNVSIEEQYAAYEFLKFATNAENTAKFAAGTGYLPVRRSAEDTETLQAVLADENDDFTKVYNVAAGQLDYAYYTAASNNSGSARTTVQEKYEAFVTGNIADIDAFVEETIAELEITTGRN